MLLAIRRERIRLEDLKAPLVQGFRVFVCRPCAPRIEPAAVIRAAAAPAAAPIRVLMIAIRRSGNGDDGRVDEGGRIGPTTWLSELGLCRLAEERRIAAEEARAAADAQLADRRAEAL